jgi:tetratricopeptide (TPR) repeat protein
VQERIDRTKKEPKAAQSEKRLVEKVATTPEIEKPEVERDQPKQTASSLGPPEQDEIQDQKAEPVGPPKETGTPESVQSGTEKIADRVIDIRKTLNRGKEQLHKGELDQAEASFQSILDQDADEHHAMEGLVEILIKRGRASEALPYCERMVKKRSRRASYRILYGDALVLVGNKEAAKQQYSEALRYSPNDEKAKRRLAKLQ